MVLDAFFELFSGKEPKPNKFTRAMGELIKKAREEAGLSQDELAQYLYVRRATISDFETGKAELTVSKLPLLSVTLDKPISYFFPEWVLRRLEPEEFSSEELEMIIQMRNLWNKDVQKIAIDQIKVLTSLDLTEMLLNNLDFAKSEYEVRKEFDNWKKNKI